MPHLLYFRLQTRRPYNNIIELAEDEYVYSSSRSGTYQNSATAENVFVLPSPVERAIYRE